MRLGLIWLFLIVVFSFIAIGCYDSDQGINPKIKGFINYSSEGKNFIDEDLCMPISEGNQLKEYYCDKQGKAKSIFIDCEVMCINGKCVNETDKKTLLQCKDTDLGENPFVKGKAHGRVSPDVTVKDFEDYCLNKNSLMEYFCNDNYVDYIMINCSCTRGHCIEKETSKNCQYTYNYYKIWKFDNTRYYSLEDSFKIFNILDYVCSKDKGCVYEKKLYKENSTTIIEGKRLYCNKGYWKGCGDSKTSCKACGLSWASLGEDHFIGSYNKAIYSCCGDDKGEYFIRGLDNTSACCDNINDSVANYVCYNSVKASKEKKINLSELRQKIINQIQNDNINPNKASKTNKVKESGSSAINQSVVQKPSKRTIFSILWKFLFGWL
jgi:hypothetical protein